VVLWAAAAYVVKRGGPHWLVSLPAAFMTATVIAYLCVAPEGFEMDIEISSAIGLAAGALSLIWFLASQKSFRANVLLELPAGTGPGQYKKA
jgi:carbon starvation protein CstA